MEPLNTFDPTTGYLGMHKEMISEADNVLAVYFNTQFALGYAQALFDLHRLRPVTLGLQREEIERLKLARLDAVDVVQGE